MKIPTDNYKKKKIIFNNRFLKSIKMNSESFHDINLQLQNDEQNILSPSNNSHLSGDDIEMNILLDNGENIQTKFYLNKNIYNEVANFCKKNKISEEGEDLILEQIDSKIAELIAQNKKNKLKNKKNEIDNQNSFTIINNKKITGDEIGQRLYEKGMKFKLKKEINIQMMKTQLKPKYDFRPHLSKKTLELTKNLYNKNTKIENRLIALGNESKKRIQKKIAEKKFLEENENTYISKSRSRSKSNNKKNNLRRNKSADVLMQKKEKNKKECLEEFYPFKPKITKMAKNMNKEIYDNIIKKYNDKYKHKKDIINQEQNNNNIKNISIKINCQNNKKPKNFINKNIKGINNTKKKQINYGLYSLEDSKNDFNEEKIKMQKKNFFEINANNKLNQIKDFKFKEIFDLLDNNNQGYLSYSNINFINIDKKILDGISPVICQINENKNKKIYFNEFKKLVNKPLTDAMLN